MMERGIPQFGFDPLTDLQLEADALELQRQEAQVREDELDQACARFRQTREGQVILDWLENAKDKPMFDWSMGFRDGAAYGFWRDGQNSWLAEIKRRAERHNERTD